MTSLLGKIAADFETQLALKISIGGTTGTLVSATDDDGVALPAGRYFFTLDKGNSRKEHISCTLSGTSLTNIKSVSRQGVETVGVVREHKVGANVIISDFGHIRFMNNLLDTSNSFDGTTPLAYDAAPTFTDDKQIVTRGYVLGVVSGGTVTYNIQTITATAGETVAAGNICYFKESDQRWWKADADLTATMDNVQISVAQGSATAGNNTTFALSGLVASFTGLTAGTKYYLSNTAGGVSTTAGTNSMLLGTSVNTTTMLFAPSKTYNNPSNFVSTSAGAADAGKGARLNASGLIDNTMLNSNIVKFGGTGADGALSVSSGTTTINLGGAQIFVKNYTSISITGTGNIAFSNPHANGTIIIFKSQGNVTIASSAGRAIDLRSIGGAGGTTGADNGYGGTSIINAGASTSVGPGTAPANDTYTLNGLKITRPIAGSVGIKAVEFVSIYTKKIELGPGTGGQGGNGTDVGGNGGGAFYMECAGAFSCSSTIDASGTNGISSGAGNRSSGGGGGGSIVILYNTLTSNTGTYNVAGGIGGVGSSPPTTSGGNGGLGYSLIGLNTEFS